MTDILLALVAVGLFALAYAVFALRATLYWLRDMIRTGQEEQQRTNERIAYQIADVAKVLEEWRESVSEPKQIEK